NRGAALLKRGDYAQAAADLRKAIQLNPDLPNAYKNLAWLQATCPEPEFRDGAEAVANATRAVRLAGGERDAGLAILAPPQAQAEAGDFEEAVRWQVKCLDQSPQEAHTDLQAQLDRYRARQAFRDTPTNRSLQGDRPAEGEDTQSLGPPANQPLTTPAK